MPKFCPDNFIPSDRTFDFAESKGLSRAQILEELEKMKDHEFRRTYTDWNRVFRNWIRKAIEIGSVAVPTSLDDSAEELGIKRQPGEDDESLRRRIGIAMTMKQYSLGGGDD